MKQKRCLTIQDYSCMGRCSLTVAIPVISTAGVETVGLPTAVLSNHTAFSAWTYSDLTDKLEESVDMWDNYNNCFDCIYTGYLGNGQPKIVCGIIKKLKKENTIVIVDPAFGDNGRLYPGFTADHVEEMRYLLEYADIITPNITEACQLLNKNYTGEKLDRDAIKQIAEALSNYGPKKIVLTGVQAENNHVGCAVYDKETKEISFYSTLSYPGKYHGAGDTFASALVGAYLNGVKLNEAVKIAHNFVHKCIKTDLDQKLDGVQYGLQFETNLNYYYRLIRKTQ